MPKQVRLRRGTTAQHAAFTGALGEVTMDTTRNTLVCHDGATPGGFALARESAQIVNTGNVLWVDCVHGNDATAQRSRLQWAFRTLIAAKAAALAGDTIVVLPGIYNEKNLAKNGVNWHFVNGATVAYSGTEVGGVFDSGRVGGACAFRVTGHGVFTVLSEPSPSAVIKSAFGADAFTIECERIEGLGSALDVAGTVVLRCSELHSASATCVRSFNPANLTIDAGLIRSMGGHGIEVAGGSVEIEARRIVSSAGKGVRFLSGTLELTAREITSSTDPALEYNSAYSALCRVYRARLVSTAAGGAGKAVVVTSGSGNLRLVQCALVATPPALVSLDALVPSTVVLQGECVANLGRGMNVTTAGSELTVNSVLT